MPKVVVCVNEKGKLEGLTPADERGYQRFKNKLNQAVPGSTFSFEYKIPRSGPMHRRHFLILGTIFDNQETFSDREQFREWGEIGAGYFDLLPAADGTLYPMARSINYETLDDAAFYEIHLRVMEFLRCLHATKRLWPHVSDIVAGNAMNSLLEEFGC